jgi:cytochrome c oxidase accessory protein FixG
MTTETENTKKVIPIAAAAPEGELISLYAAHEKIYPRSVKGTFTNWRWIMVWVTQLVFYGLPWLDWGHRQAVLFDLGVRRFYIFGLVLYPQDFIYLTGLLIISALSLFLFTAVAGRLWCGYACPQTVYTEIFLWFEKLAEGDRSARMRRDEGPMTTEKFGRKVAKHGMWILFSLLTGFTFVGYFAPIKELAADILSNNMSAWGYFWVVFYSFATYGNAGFMREQVCKHMCPYARFQSAMFDKDTLIVTYDEERGEPRGARSKKADPTKLNLGACVDCGLCVQVCPTGIDIRKGLQYECIGCGACADVCDTVMDKVGYPRGLVKYSTENAMKNKWDRAATIKRVLRPRVLVYTSILAAIVVVIFGTLAMRTPFKVDIVRDRGVMARIVDAGKIENVYRLQVMNASETDQHYQITVEGLPGISINSDSTLSVAATQAKTWPLSIQVPPDAAEPGSHSINLVIQRTDGPGRLVEKTTFMIPR